MDGDTKATSYTRESYIHHTAWMSASKLVACYPRKEGLVHCHLGSPSQCFADEGELYQRSLSCQDEIKMATSRSLKLLDALLHSCLTIHLYKVCCGKFLDTSPRTGNEERRSPHHAVPVLQASSFKFKFCSISVGLWAQAHAQSAQVQSGYFILSYHCAFLYALPSLVAPPRCMTSQGAIIGSFKVPLIS